jgi:hypothetical protein
MARGGGDVDGAVYACPGQRHKMRTAVFRPRRWFEALAGDVAQIVHSARTAGCEGIFPKKCPKVCWRDLILT